VSFDQVEITKAVLAALATLGVAALGLFGVIISSRKPSKAKPPTTTDTGKALDSFNGTQNEFMALVIADNKTQREELHELRAAVESIKKHQDTFLGAVRRYLIKLATAWNSTDGPMPWPDDPDFQILEETLPNWRGTKK
jgi:hypothetical protein